ncbi:MAG: hypothetical protein JXB34_00280, partial [Bacteroidales bacterium]|nr:hypothetical protein [Bacteroidales bacterium]
MKFIKPLKCQFLIFFLPIIFISCSHCKTESLYQPGYDSLSIVLENIGDRDQSIRKKLVDSLQEGTPEFRDCISQMVQIDNENREILLQILEKYGWLPQSKIGEKASESIFYVLQHSNILLIEKYYPQLDSLAKISEANPKHAAMMMDRLLMSKGKKQIYGTQASSTLRADGKPAIWPI